MPQQAQNQSVTSQSTTPHPNQPQPTNNKPDAFARLAEAVDRTLKRLNHPKAEKSSAPKGTRPSRPATAEKTSASSGLLCGSGLQPRQNSASREDFLLRASPAQGIGSRPKDSATRPSPARGDLRSRARSGTSTVSQAKNYLRATRPPKFLNPNRSLERHARKCAICHHPEREMIEELFVHWHSPQSIVDFLADYDNVNWVSIYRHAYALGLDAVRRRNLGFVFENILDNAADATPTAAGVVAAARAISCINSEGHWVEPPKRILMTTLVRKQDPSATASTEPDSSPARSIEPFSSPPPARRGGKAAVDSEGTSPADALCGSGIQPRQNAPSRESFLLRASPAQSSRLVRESAAHASSRERIEGRGPISGLRSSPSDSETGARPSTPMRASARRSLVEESVSVPSTSLPKAALDHPARSASHSQVQEAALSASSLPEAAVNAPAPAQQTPPSGELSAARRNEFVATRTPSPAFPGLARSETREIRLPLNSHQTKDKPVSNR